MTSITTTAAADISTTDINLSIKSLEQQTKSVSLPRNSSILDLKHKIQVLFDVEGTRQRLIFQGKVLKDDKTLLDYENLDDGKLIHLVIRPINLSHNPANDEPTQRQQQQGTTARQISDRYAVITLEATLGDLADNTSLVSTLMNHLMPSAVTTLQPPQDHSTNSPFSPRPPHQSLSRSALLDPLRGHSHSHHHQVGRGTRGGQHGLSTLLGLNDINRRHIVSATTAGGIDDFINGLHNGRNSSSFTMNNGDFAATTVDDPHTDRATSIGLPLPSTVEMRLSRTLSYIREIRLLLDQPILEAADYLTNNLNRQNRRQHVSSLRAIRESRELLRNQGVHHHAAQVAVVIEELADLMDLLAPWLRNLGQSLTAVGEDEQDTQHQLAHVLRAARIIQITSLIHHFLSSVLASAEPVVGGTMTTETWNPFSTTTITNHAERIGRSFTAAVAAGSSSSTSTNTASTTEQEQQDKEGNQLRAKRKHSDSHDNEEDASFSSSSAKKSKTLK